MILTPDTLDAVFRKWHSNKEHSLFSVSSYQNVLRNGHVGKNFESWLWKNGMMVQQRENKRYLVCYRGDKHATLFLMKHL